MSDPERPWSVPVKIEDVPEDGLSMHITADESVRERIAALGGLTGLSRLEADFAITPQGRRFTVGGTVTATAGQICVVTLEPMESEISEQVDLVFAPDPAEGLATPAGEPVAESPAAGASRDPAAAEPPEPLENGTIDLGAVATEFLLLGIDPYPRKPGAVFDAPDPGPAEPGPFAALAALAEKNRKD